jgi:hypothetical protein
MPRPGPSKPFLALLPFALAACLSQEQPKEIEDACGAGELQHFVGQSLAAFDAKLVKAPLRVIYPDSPVTMDYNPERLNVMVSKFGVIESLTCG